MVMKAGRFLFLFFIFVAAGSVAGVSSSTRQEVGGTAPASPSGPILAWGVLLGSAAPDEGRTVAVDGSGNVYVAGTSDAAWGKPVRAYGGGRDAFVAKLAPGGTLLWLTFLGGAGADAAAGIAMDGSGNVLVAGTSDASWGTPLRPIGSIPGNANAFAAKLGPGGVLLWNTFVGIGEYDRAAAIAVDASSNVLIAGHASFGGAFIEAFAAKQTPVFEGN